MARMLPEHDVWTAPGYGAWVETALSPEGLAAFAPQAVFLLLDRSHGGVDESMVPVAKRSLEDKLPLATVAVVDLEDLADETPGFYDERLWRLASQPWSLAGLKSIASEIERLIGCMHSGTRKVLAVDFDGVLWSGVIGEDGVSGISPRLELQRWLLALKARGIVLVGLSKNNAGDVEEIWRDARMLVGKEDFVAMRVDWNPKVDNLIAVAGELNLGLESFVFLDDSAAERVAMSARLPMVAVPDWPAGGDALPKFLRHIERLYFPELRVTAEDRVKTSQYQAEVARRTLAKDVSIDEYLASLGIWVDVHEARDDEFPRVAQLSQKSNQFNVATNRYTIDEVAKLAEDGKNLILTVYSGDRFGDLGLIAFAVAQRAGEKASITDFVMSCRAMSRRIEFTIEKELERRLAALGVREIAAAWKRTAKNAPVENLFDAFGYEVVSSGPDEKRYRLMLPVGGS